MYSDFQVSSRLPGGRKNFLCPLPYELGTSCGTLGKRMCASPCRRVPYRSSRGITPGSWRAHQVRFEVVGKKDAVLSRRGVTKPVSSGVRPLLLNNSMRTFELSSSGPQVESWTSLAGFFFGTIALMPSREPDVVQVVAS